MLHFTKWSTKPTPTACSTWRHLHEKNIHKLDNCDVQKGRFFPIITRFEVIILVLKCNLNSLYNLDTPIGILGKTERPVSPEKPFTNYSHWCSIISPFSSTNSNHFNQFKPPQHVLYPSMLFVFGVTPFQPLQKQLVGAQHSPCCWFAHHDLMKWWWNMVMNPPWDQNP